MADCDLAITLMPGHKYRPRELEIRIGVMLFEFRLPGEGTAFAADDWANADFADFIDFVDFDPLDKVSSRGLVFEIAIWFLRCLVFYTP
ncbi:hypothetical protein M5D96_002516 [Drosophila gunungcola]|uniref:Uncharacterized protein n=1 Tax=Drosophila gunungcola TaxID=103775 RepID=A0A9P9Z070_9MUSC|nr:hypothetical protein M5D96_002516 [Drosophila gunungcola]